MSSMKEAIFSRRSVRTFHDQKLSEEMIRELKEFSASLTNPFGNEIRFVFLEDSSLSSAVPVINEAPLFVCCVAKKGADSEEAAGFEFEKFCLKAVSMGLGTVIIGGTMKREEFESRCSMSSDEYMPVMTPVGFPAKPSVRERMMRRGVRADSRKEKIELFFDQDLLHPLTMESADLSEALEAVRKGPSAVNKQPWRIIYRDTVCWFYKTVSRRYTSEETGDMQKVDLGIALCHFVTVLDENAILYDYIFEDPQIAGTEDLAFVCGVRV